MIKGCFVPNAKRGQMLTSAQFDVLISCLEDGKEGSQRAIADKTNLSLGTVNSTLKELRVAGLVDEDCAITEAGKRSLEPYRVDNAIILAAGLSSRFVPISYEKPKGVVKVKGEVLIERQIRQLREAGISDIVVVVGYRKEEFFYLEDRFGVELVVNNEYAERNNNSSIKVVASRLGNTYICSSDDYFTENPFERYVYCSYYAAEFEAGETKEWCLTTKGKNRLITDVAIGGADAWVMMGHAYWDRAFSKRFLEILDDVYDDPATADKLWEQIYVEHINELPMVMRPYPQGAIWEFDSLDDVRRFDPAFIVNVNSSIMDNICRVLHCERNDITDIIAIKQGLTNFSFRFSVGDDEYVYRHPGEGTDKIISRASETFTQSVAYDLGIDRTYIYEDEVEGWKISRFIPDCVPFEYHNPQHVKRAMEMIRALHNCGVVSEWDFDIHTDTLKQIALLNEGRRTSFEDFEELLALAEKLNAVVKADGLSPVLSHNDFYDANFLVHGDDMYLIDWEYAGMSDYASDLAVFICCSDYTYDEAMEVLEVYFERPLEPHELLHCVAYLSVVSFHWFVWALYRDMCGDPVGEFLYLWYKYTKRYGQAALRMIEEA